MTFSFSPTTYILFWIIIFSIAHPKIHKCELRWIWFTSKKLYLLHTVYNSFSLRVYFLINTSHYSIAFKNRIKTHCSHFNLKKKGKPNTLGSFLERSFYISRSKACNKWGFYWSSNLWSECLYQCSRHFPLNCFWRIFSRIWKQSLPF